MGRKDNIAGDGRRELQNGITTLFLIYMGAAYPLIMHDKYFDITVTKYRAFYIALCIYAVLMVLAVLWMCWDGMSAQGMGRRAQAGM